MKIIYLQFSAHFIGIIHYMQTLGKVSRSTDNIPVTICQSSSFFRIKFKKKTTVGKIERKEIFPVNISCCTNSLLKKKRRPSRTDLTNKFLPAWTCSAHHQATWTTSSTCTISYQAAWDSSIKWYKCIQDRHYVQSHSECVNHCLPIRDISVSTSYTIYKYIIFDVVTLVYCQMNKHKNNNKGSKYF